MEVDNPPKRELEVEQKSSVSCSERWSRKGGVTSTPWKVWEIDPNLPIWYRETRFTPITVLASSPRWSRRFGHHPGGVQGDPSWFSRVKTLAMRVELRRLLGMLYILVRCTPPLGRAPFLRTRGRESQGSITPVFHRVRPVGGLARPSQDQWTSSEKKNCFPH